MRTFIKTFFAIFISGLALYTNAVNAQNGISLKGRLIDSATREPLQLSTIAVLDAKDSSLISYTLSNRKGEFSLRNLPSGKELRVYISCLGYEPYKRNFRQIPLTTIDVGEIHMIAHEHNLSEVDISGERQPIIFKKDTIEFAPEAFKTRPNAVLEDLLKKLPGLQVDADGSIYTNGKKIKKITVNGNDYFVSDITIASKNINVDLIDKVQIVNDRQDDPDNLKSELEVDKVINIKLKKNLRKSLFGKVYGGAGTDSRFEGGGLINISMDTLQVSLIGFDNNINRVAFSDNDLNKLGGFERSAVATNSLGLDFGGSSGGIQKITSGGINISYDWKKKVKFNFLYLYTHIDDNIGNTGYSQQFISGDTLLTKFKYDQNTNLNEHNLSSLIQWNLKPNSYLRYQVVASLSDINTNYLYSKDNQNNSFADVSSGNTSNYSNDRSFQYSHILTFYKKYKKSGKSLNITHNLSVNPKNNFLNTNLRTIDYNPFSDTTLRQVNYHDQAQTSGYLDVYYRQGINKKIVADLRAVSKIDQNVQTITSYNFDPLTNQYDNFIASQSSKFNRDQFSMTAAPGITWTFKKESTFRISSNFQYTDVNNDFNSLNQKLTKQYFYVLPSISFSIPAFSFNYNSSMRLPSITQIQPNETYTSAFTKSIGNPDLKPVVNQRASVEYNKFLPDPQINFSLSTNFNFDENPIINSKSIDLVGFTNIKPINSGKNAFDLTNSLRFGKKFKKHAEWENRLNAELYGDIHSTPFYINNFEDQQRSYDIGAVMGLAFDWKNVVIFEPSYSVNHNINSFKENVDYNKDFYRYTLNNALTVLYPKNIVLDFNYKFIYDTQISNNFDKSRNLLNASISLQTLKNKKGELKITAFDLLNQNSGIYSGISNNIIVYGHNLVLHRYFLFSFTYNFNTSNIKKNNK